MSGSGFLEFRLDYSETKNIAIGDSVISDYISAGGHLWRIICYPRGFNKDVNGEYVSIFLEVELCSDSKAGPCSSIIVLGADTIAVPSSNIGCDLGFLLESDAGTDVSFIVKGETIQAHCAILAARSPVFQAELFGTMSDATSPSITLQDMEPEVFKAMLVFVYTDELPEDEEFGDSVTDMMQHLLAAADHYALDRLKLMCARKLWNIISVDAFASTLACAETHNCPELKSKCIDFFAVEENFKKIVFTAGFMWLVQKFPDLAAKLKERVGT
ncbi:unnamed protein product [Urochloa decumbens]|uniref:BTB domain-containing protein n=1 Tax=Urochloa decumbens TaxID=240449 RepID=A0ABC9BJ93_9POAL